MTNAASAGTATSGTPGAVPPPPGFKSGLEGHVAFRTQIAEPDKDGGALGKMLPFFKAGVGGPVAGGRQLMPWVHADDVAGIYLRAIDDASWSGAVNATAPEPVSNKTFSQALGRALHRPAIAPVPAFAWPHATGLGIDAAADRSLAASGVRWIITGDGLQPVRA